MEHEPGLADADLVAVLEPVRGPTRSPLTDVPFDDPRSLTHQPAENCSRTACKRLAVGVVLERHVVLGCLADRHAAGVQRNPPASHARDHLDLRGHDGVKPTPWGSDAMALPLAAGRLLGGRYEVLERLGAGGEAHVVKALDRRFTSAWSR